MQNDSNVEITQAEIPEYLRCEMAQSRQTEIDELSQEITRLKYLVGEKIGHPSVRDLLDAEVQRQLEVQKQSGNKEILTDEDIENLIKGVLKDHDENPDKYWINIYKQVDDLKKKLEELSNPTLQSHCMIGQTWFMKGTQVSALIKYAEESYKTEVIAQNSKIKFDTDDNEVWWAHDVPFFGTVQMNWCELDADWDIYLDGCWQGPFNSKSECIKHLEECIQEKREEQSA